jgi:signal transduction histidine kinase
LYHRIRVADSALEADLDFRLLFEGSPDILLVLRPDAPRFTMVAATDSRLAVTHTTREGTLGRGLFDVFPDNPDDVAATGTSNLRASLDRVVATRAPDTMAVQKYDVRGPDGTFEARYWSPRNIPILSSTGEVRFILHRVEEVTDLVRASEQGEELRGRTREMELEVLKRSRELSEANGRLREANAKLGELDAAKTTFFGNVSHELRTPLTLMLGPLEDALADHTLPAAHRTRVELAHANALRLLKLVNALLDFSRLEAGRLRARYAPLDLAGLTRELAGMFQSAADSSGVRLAIDCPPPSQPAWVDRDMWEKIVSNLVSNALKFTHAGHLAVRLREKAERFVLEVEDTGVGIPEAELPRIFERFHRVEGSKGRTYEGTGIGLSLVRELVELHGGRVTVESAVGRGSTFRVELPKGYAHLPPEAVSQQPADAHVGRDARAYASEAERWADRPAGDAGAPVPARPSRRPDGAARARILVVDDNADLRSYLSTLLSDHYDVTTAPDGLAALEAVRASAPDLVVSDVMMPRLDGVAMVRELRVDPRTASLPVILLSARVGEDSSIAGLDAGSDDYLAKPFSAKELLARVRTHIELARTRRAWTTELERANRELDAFSYSVSHDLRAPLRSIGGFTQAIAEEYGAQLDAKGRDYVGRIVGGVERMGELVDALLALARISRAPVVAGDVDLSSVAARVVADLRHASPDRSVDVAIAGGLVARGDRALLDVVLVNLLGNAWKFTSKTEGARIDLGRTDDGAFYVRDNGAGFDAAYAGRLFAPFQRLHSKSDFEGTGVGLATVQRVIHRHGGRVWAESAEGKGATFFFTVDAGSG